MAASRKVVVNKSCGAMLNHFNLLRIPFSMRVPNATSILNQNMIKIIFPYPHHILISSALYIIAFYFCLGKHFVRIPIAAGVGFILEVEYFESSMVYFCGSVLSVAQFTIYWLHLKVQRYNLTNNCFIIEITRNIQILNSIY